MPLRTYSTWYVRLAMGVVTSIDPEILLLDEVSAPPTPNS